MAFKSHSLNLWAVEDDNHSKLDIDAHTDRIDFTTTMSQPIKIHPNLELVHASGNILDLANTIKVIESDLVSNSTTASSGNTLVQSNLDSYKTSNNISVGNLQSSLAVEVAQRLQGQIDDASARALNTSVLNTTISAESSLARTSEAALGVSISTESSLARSSEAALGVSISTVNTSLNSKITVQQLRIDDIVGSTSIDLDTLKELSDAYSNVDSNTLNQISDMTITLNSLIHRVNALTSSTDVDFVVALNTAIAELDMINNKGFLTQPFSINYDMRDMYASTLSTMLGWAAYKTIIISTSSGALTNSSTDSEVETYLKTVLDAAYGAAVLSGSTLADYRLKYSDFSNYLLETNLTATKPVFKGVVQTSLSDCEWRLSYCSIAGDPTSIYSTILSGSQSSKTLTITPTHSNLGIEYPVSGVSGNRDGYKTTYTQFSMK
jgi:hypothetical protein